MNISTENVGEAKHKIEKQRKLIILLSVVILSFTILYLL